MVPSKMGVLALQGSFIEHAAKFTELGVNVIEVRTPDELASCSGLVIPGGESTAMGLIAAKCGMLEPLRQWTVAGKPVWGTCAGMIMVADRAEGQKAGGQALIGGLDILVSRNYFGSQSASFEAPLEIAPISLSDSASSGGGDVIVTASSSLSSSSSSSHSLLAAVSIVAPIGVFIRAPAILQCGVGVVPLAFVSDPRATADSDKRRVCVAAASHAIVVTAFHPELSRGTAWHAFFARLVEARTGVTLLPIATAAAVTFDASSPLPTTFDSELATSGNGMVYGVARRVVPGEAPWGSSKNHA